MATDKRYQQVTCAHCQRTYTCTPMDDYYDDIPDWTEDGGLCEQCLLKRAGMDNLPIHTIIASAEEQGIFFKKAES